MERITWCGLMVLILTLTGTAQEPASPDSLTARAEADPVGTWKWERTFGDSQMDYTLQLKRDKEGKLSGAYTVQRNDAASEPIPLEDLKVVGNQLTFRVHLQRNDREFTISYEGLVSEDSINGVTKANFGGEDRQFDWNASRAVSTEGAKWIPLFDGKSLAGWERVGNPDSLWEVRDGALTATGPASMLVNTTGPYKNFRYRAEVKISDGGNSGMYFRTTRRPGFSDGYEAQIDSTHRDPIRTGSLYGMCHVYQQHVKPDTWFSYELDVRDDVWRGRKMTRIKITINDNELYEYLDFDLTFSEGYFAFQHHDPESIVSIRKVEVMPLP